jgi:sugar lactone lactonase YvrE
VSTRAVSVFVTTLALAPACGSERTTDVQRDAEGPPPAVPPRAGAEYTPLSAEVVQPQPEDPEPTATIMVTGFDTPESVLHDTDADVYYVANIGGPPTQKDDNGFISKISPEGKTIALKWIDGRRDVVQLDAPKGMAIVGDTLWVADIDRVRKFDRKTGAPTGDIAIESATFLADVAAGPDGVVYVSDTGEAPSGAIHRIENDQPRLLAQGEALGGPNGLAVNAAGLWVVGFRNAQLMRIGGDGKPADVTALPAGQLDGLVITPDGQFLVSSWEAAAIYAGKPGGTFTTLFQGLEAPADIGFDVRRGRLLVPRFHADVVELRPVKAALDKHAAR